MSLSLQEIHGLVAKVPSSSFFGLPVPYDPVSNKDLLEASKKATIQTDNSVGPCPVKHVPKEILEVIFSYIANLEDFKNISEVCKTFYRVSKAEALWKNHFCSLLPDVCPLTSETSFTIEAQFKIAFEAHKSAIKKLMASDKCLNVLGQRCSEKLIKIGNSSVEYKVCWLQARLNSINNQENFEKMIKHVEHYDKFANSLLYIKVSKQLRILTHKTLKEFDSKFSQPLFGRLASSIIQMSRWGQASALLGYVVTTAVVCYPFQLAGEWCRETELPDSIAIGRALFRNYI